MPNTTPVTPAIPPCPGATIGTVTVTPPPDQNLTTSIYRIEGTATGTATASTDPTSTPTIGNTVTINGPVQSVSWRFATESPQTLTGDDTITVNGWDYISGTGEVYGGNGWEVSASNDEQINNTYAFTANGDACAEIIVIRKA